MMDKVEHCYKKLRECDKILIAGSSLHVMSGSLNCKYYRNLVAFENIFLTVVLFYFFQCQKLLRELGGEGS